MLVAVMPKYRTAFFTNNSASYGGGGISISGYDGSGYGSTNSSVKITYCTFSGNIAGMDNKQDADGGIEAGSNCYAEIRDCTFSNNTSEHFGHG